MEKKEKNKQIIQKSNVKEKLNQISIYKNCLKKFLKKK